RAARRCLPVEPAGSRAGASEVLRPDHHPGAGGACRAADLANGGSVPEVSHHGAARRPRALRPGPARILRSGSRVPRDLQRHLSGDDPVTATTPWPDLLTVLVVSGGGFQGLSLVKSLRESPRIRIVLVDSYEENVSRYFADAFYRMPEIAQGEAFVAS